MEDFIKYRAFIEAARSGSITSAALLLDYTQPGISHMIHKLEKDFGFPLLYRSKQGVVLTEGGERIFKICSELLEKENELQAAVGQINGTISGTLQIGSYLSVLTQWGPHMIEAIGQAHPQLHLQFFEGNADVQLQLLRSNAIDIGIFSSSAPEDFQFIPIHNDPIVAIIPFGHPLCQKDTLSADDLCRSNMLIQSEGSVQALTRILGEQYASAKSSIITKNDQAQLRLVESGLGIGIVGKMTVSHTTPVCIKNLDKPYARTIGLAVPCWRPITPVLREFVQWVCNTYQDESFRDQGHLFWKSTAHCASRENNHSFL